MKNKASVANVSLGFQAKEIVPAGHRDFVSIFVTQPDITPQIHIYWHEQKLKVIYFRGWVA